MKALPHHYEVHLTGGPSGYAELSTSGAPVLRAAPPVEFDGPGDAWSPEHLLLASVQTCFLLTLRAIGAIFAGIALARLVRSASNRAVPCWSCFIMPKFIISPSSCYGTRYP